MGQSLQTERKVADDQLSVRAEDQELELLRKFVRKGVIELKPSLNAVGIHYPEAEEFLKSSDLTQVRVLLEDLANKGLLKPKLIDRVLTCPRCSSPEVHSKYTCPKCSSDGVELTELLEHMKCGYIGPKTDFIKGLNLVCPRCQAALTEKAVNYRVIGNFFLCEDCGNRFDRPEILHICQNCGKSSSYQEAKYVKMLSYRVSEEVIREYGRELPIFDNIRKMLMDSGFRVRLHSKAIGSSGVQSPFDIIAEKDNVRFVMDVSVEGSKNDIIALLAKKVDVNPTKALILDLSDSDELTLLGKIYDIIVFKARADQNQPDGFQNFLTSISSQES